MEAKFMESCQSDNFCSISQLNIGEKYKILNLTIKPTRYGPCLLATINTSNTHVWLPKRFLKTFDDKLVKEYNSEHGGSYYLETSPNTNDKYPTINILKY